MKFEVPKNGCLPTKLGLSSSFLIINAGLFCVPSRDLSSSECVWEMKIMVLAHISEEMQHQETVRIVRKPRG